jgi:uncharacterized protein (DUF433 family)
MKKILTGSQHHLDCLVMSRWADRISTDPQVCHGKACVAGTRVLVSVVLDNLAAGESPAQIAKDYRITPEDISAVLAYAAELAREDLVFPGAA